MQPCPPGDSTSLLTFALVALAACAMVGAIFWLTRDWFARSPTSQRALALIGWLALYGFVAFQYVAPLADQAILRAAGREATATVQSEYVTGGRSGNTLIDYSFTATLRDGSRCALAREGERLLGFVAAGRVAGDEVQVRYLPDQPTMARVAASAASLAGHTLTGVFLICLPAVIIGLRGRAARLRRGQAT
jgi:hypothetical protein